MAKGKNATGELEAIIARTALKYDLLPYQSKAFAQSQPGRLGGLARLFGLEAVPLAKARVLELGCASGGNIIPLAARFPEAQFVGVDLSRTQVAAGRARISELELGNIEILCQSFTEIDEKLGDFDYIICHGVYSWVPPLVQEAIMKITRARLSPHGVAYISYNVLPGWRMLQNLRDAFLLTVPDHNDSVARVAKARELLSFLKDATPDKGPYGLMLKTWHDRLAGLPDDYIAHEFLEETNSPSTVRDFAASAARHDLAFLGECDLHSMIVDNYPTETAQRVREMTNNDLVESEQMLDLITGRTFRQTLLVGKERLNQINRALGPACLEGLYFLTGRDLKLARTDSGATLTDGAGRQMTTTFASVAAGLERLVERFPAASSIDDCAVALTKAQLNEGGRALLADALYRMLIVGMIGFSSEPVDLASSVSAKPLALVLARADAAAGAEHTTNARHETVFLDAGARTLLPALDGKRDSAALVKTLLDAAKAGQLTFNRDGQPVTDPKAMPAIAAEFLPLLLSSIAAAGLLVS